MIYLISYTLVRFLQNEKKEFNRNMDSPIMNIHCTHFVFILFDSDGTIPPPTKKMKMWQNKRKREEERKKQLVKEMIEDIEKGNLQQFY